MGKKNVATAGGARERIRVERERQAIAQKRRDRMLRLGITIVVVVVLVGVGGVVAWQRSTSKGPVPRQLVRVSNGHIDGGTAGMGDPVSGPGNADAPVLIEVFDDFLCPHCGTFERSATAYLDEQAAAGQVKAVYYPVTMDMFEEPTELAANAYVCAASNDPEKAQGFRELLYRQQRPWNNDQLIEAAKTVGLSSQSFGSCVNSRQYDGYLDSIDQAMADRGEDGTPAVFVNGTKVQGRPGQELGGTDLEAAVRG